MALLDEYFGGFGRVQYLLRRALLTARNRKGLTWEKLAFLSAQPSKTLRAVEDGEADIDQQLLESVAFPLELMPNTILSVRLSGEDLIRWQKKLGDAGAGFQKAGGNESRLPLPSCPTSDECESFIVLCALEEMDEVVEKRKAGQGKQ